MSYPYLLTSDEHCHNWSQFAHINSDGINSRLAAILNEKRNAHAALFVCGGSLHVSAGDLFHVRGKIEPSVFNPTFDTIVDLHRDNPKLETIILPGNHDLEGKNSSRLGNAMQQLDKIKGVTVATAPTWYNLSEHEGIFVFPWYQDLDQLRDALKERAANPGMGVKPSDIDVVIHAPVNGVIKGIPDHGLEADELAALGFRRVFAGHYHNHKELIPGKVWSIGATTHQTWNDPGTTAGFMLVFPDRVEHFESAAPKFVDITAIDIDDESELEMLVTGNFVRAKIDGLTEAEIVAFRKQLEDYGAKGVTIISQNSKRPVSRTGTTISASKTLEASVAEYIENQLKPTQVAEVQKLCGDLIAQARSEA